MSARKDSSTRLKPRVNSPSKERRTCPPARSDAFSRAFHEPRLLLRDSFLLPRGQARAMIALFGPFPCLCQAVAMDSHGLRQARFGFCCGGSGSGAGTSAEEEGEMTAKILPAIAVLAALGAASAASANTLVTFTG